MTIEVESELPAFVPAPQSLKRFTLDEYHKAIQAGLFDKGEPVELIEGWVINKMGHRSSHFATWSGAQSIQSDSSNLIPAPNLIRRFTVEEYHQAIQADVFGSDARTELLEGWIVYKMTHNPLHDSTVDRVQEVLRDRVSKDWRVRVQSAITTATSEPEPDIVIAKGPASRYAKNHPAPADIALIVEVADSSLDRDRNEKGLLYAHAGIAIYWIINLPESVVEVYSKPRARRYGKPERFGIKNSVPLIIAGKTLPPIPVKELLP